MKARNPRVSGAMVVIATSIIAATCLTAEEAAKPGAEWPQWRGPTRDGIAPAGPKLLDSWPANGPKQIWKSGFIQGTIVGGGFSSVVVADGKVIVYSNSRERKEPVVLISADRLKKWGWVADMPPDIVTKIEGARADKDKKKLKPGPELDSYINQFLGTLDPAIADKYQESIKNRLMAPSLRTDVVQLLDWQTTTGCAEVKDKAFSSYQQAFDGLMRSPKVAEGLTYNDNVCVCIGNILVEAFPASDSIICLDASTGKELWRKDFPGRYEVGLGQKHWPASATPAISEGKCYVQGSAGFYCLSLKDGAEAWKIKTAFSHSSPMVLDGVAYAMHPCLTAYAADTGKLLWTQGAGAASAWNANTSVIPWRNHGKLSLISLGAGNAPYCIDPKDGKVIWETAKSSASACATPVIAGDILIGADCAMKLSPQGVERIWKSKGEKDRGASLTVYNGYVYTHQRYQKTGPWCSDLKTGVEKWKGPGDYSGECNSPIVADDKLIGCAGGTVLMYRANPEEYEGLGRFKVNVTICTSPAIVDGKLFLRLDDGIACYDLQEHGVFLDGVAVKSDALTFRFKQTGGGLVATDAARGELKDVVITDTAGVAKPAAAKIDGENVVINIKNVPIPFSISYSGNGALVGKNGLPAPAFHWNAVRVLKFAKCFDETIVLTSNLPLNNSFCDAGKYNIAGAKVTNVIPNGGGVTLTTDRTWKAGDTVTLTYPCFKVDEGDPRLETLTFTSPDIVRATAKFVKFDETTSGTWKGVYGAEGMAILRDAGSVAPQCAVVTPKNQQDHSWADTTPELRALQKSGEAKDRIAACWYSDAAFDIDVGVTDGKEHQVALYFMDWDGLGRAAKVEVRDVGTDAVLDTQTVADFKSGKYLIWNVKGQISFHITSTGNANATISGVFVDPAGQAGK